MTQDAPFTDEPSVDVVLRFERGERLVHWAIAVPFMICYLSAAVLFFYYNPDPTRAYRAVFAWIHRISGACLMYLVLARTLRKRRLEESEAAAA